MPQSPLVSILHYGMWSSAKKPEPRRTLASRGQPATLRDFATQKANRLVFLPFRKSHLSFGRVAHQR